MSSTLQLPILRELVPNGFNYGTNLLVEFDPYSIWYETSLTIAAHAVKDGIKTDYHTFQRSPNEVREALRKLNVNIEELEETDVFGIIDSFTVQTGLGAPKPSEKGRRHFQTQSVKLSDWSIPTAQEMKEGSPERQNRRLHIDDNTGILLQYNDEKVFVDLWRTRFVPLARTRELAFVHSIVPGIASDAFYRQFESSADGIIDFKMEDKSGEIQHYVRVKVLRGRPFDSRWHKIRVLENGEVALTD